MGKFTTLIQRRQALRLFDLLKYRLPFCQTLNYLTHNQSFTFIHLSYPQKYFILLFRKREEQYY